MKLIKIIITKLGIDGAIFYTLVGRGLQIFTSVFTIFFIAKFLSPNEQGYYYTFGSIVAIQVFFELGLNGIITQFVAHEASHLFLNENYGLVGDIKYKSRLSSLLRFCVKWYLIFALGLLTMLVVVGFIFFSKYEVKQQDIIWKLPWILLAIGTVFNFLLAPITAFLEGLGKIKEVAQLRLVQQLSQPIVIWGGLAIGSKLFVSGADAILKVFIVSILILKSPFFKILKKIWKEIGDEKIEYIKEIFPYQWRIALSWISGYFIFQLFNPVLFASEGAKVAGQMGMTITVLNGLTAMTLSWINTKIPKLSGFIALKQYSALDNLFMTTLKQILFVGIAIMLFLLLAIFLIQKYDITILGIKIGERLLPILPMSIMSYAVFLQIPISCMATYLRCHKKEPLLINSIVGGILSCFSVLVLGKYFGLYGITIGFAFLQTFVGVLWVFLIFKRKKKDWHRISLTCNEE